jgi:hypothetical protein
MGETKETHVTMQMMHETIEKAEEVMLKCQLENKTKDSLIEKYKTKLLAVMEDNKRLKDDSVKLQSALMQLKGKQQKRLEMLRECDEERKKEKKKAKQALYDLTLSEETIVELRLELELARKGKEHESAKTAAVGSGGDCSKVGQEAQ